MCPLGHSFAIKAMARRGIDTVLIRDLTDTMYNPAMRPWMRHDAGTTLVVDFVEKFWCPTVSSEEVVEGLSRS
jgi:hypothetical protein